MIRDNSEVIPVQRIYGTVNAWLSIGRYRETAERVKRLPKSITCQAIWQQNGLVVYLA